MKPFMPLMIATFAFNLAAFGQVQAETVQEDVRIRLPADADAEAAYAEVRKQARVACNSRAIYAHRHRPERKACEAQFIEDAVDAFDRPELSAWHREQTGSGNARRMAGDID